MANPINSQTLILRALARATAGLKPMPFDALLKSLGNLLEKAEQKYLQQWRQARSERITEDKQFKDSQTVDRPASVKSAEDTREETYLPERSTGFTSSH